MRTMVSETATGPIRARALRVPSERSLRWIALAGQVQRGDPDGRAGYGLTNCRLHDHHSLEMRHHTRRSSSVLYRSRSPSSEGPGLWTLS